MATAQRHQRTKVFISYSHQDIEWLRRLRIHLRPLERDRQIEIWDDTRISSGSKWREEIEQALATTAVAVLLISADFLASDFIATDELPQLLGAAEKEGAVILPIILSPSRLLKTPSLAQFQSVNNVSTPLIEMSKAEQEAVLVKATEDIEAALNRAPDGADGTSRGCERTRAKAHARDHDKRYKFPKLHPAIWAAIVGGAVALVTAYWQFVYKPAPPLPEATVQYTGRVTDQTSQQAIRGAKVSVEAQGVPQVYYTDSDGIFYVKLAGSINAARIRVEAAGYEPFDRNVSLSRDAVEDVRLKSVGIPPVASPSVMPDTPAARNENQTPNRNSTPRPKPTVNTEADLERRKQRARDFLDTPSSSPTP